MKKILFTIIVALCNLSLYSQQWAMDEAAEDTKLSDSLSIGSIIIGVLFIGALVCLYRYAKKLKTFEKNTYYKHVKFFAILSLLTGVIVFSAIEIYYSNKRDSLEEIANDKFTLLCNKVDLYVEIYDKIPISLSQIEPNDFYSSANQIYGNNNYYFEESDDNNSHYFNCYDILEGPRLGIAYAKAAKGLSFNKSETAGLYNFWIRPYRIRYFTEQSNPKNDIVSTFPYFIDSLLKNYNYEIEDGMLEGLTDELGNEYFKVEGIDIDVSSDEIWLGHKKIENNTSNDLLNVYEYETLNFGNFEIMYCITLSSKLGLVEKTISDGSDNIYGFDYISQVEKNSCLMRFFRVYLFIVLLLFITFILGLPRK